MIRTYNPPPLEVFLTLLLGRTLLSPYYRNFAHRLNLRGNEKVLDFGSGSGVCSRHIAARLQKGGQLDCLDISEVWQTVIQKEMNQYKNVNYHLGNIANVDLPDNYFDMVVIHFVFHEILMKDRSLEMKIIARKLKPSGRLVIREPQGHGLTMEEFDNFTQLAGLKKVTFQPRKIIFVEVMDGIFEKHK